MLPGMAHTVHAKAAFWDTVMYVVPAWVAFVSLFILRNQRRRGCEADTTGDAGMSGSGE